MKEHIYIEMEVERFRELCYTEGLTDQDYKIKKIDIPDYDYSGSEEWKMQKRKADQEYRKLKEIEFDIRHNNKSGGPLG